MKRYQTYTRFVPLFSRPKNPPWLDSAREFCNARDITIMWGPHALIVEAKPRNALLKFPPNSRPLVDDDYAGILTLSHPE